jgi:hypothetical protein
MDDEKGVVSRITGCLCLKAEAAGSKKLGR